MANRHGNRVAHAVRTLLERERTFDSETREYFWSTHTEKVAAWQEAMAEALDSGHLSGTESEFAILSQTVREMSIVSSVALTVDPDVAHRNPDAVRALVFSNVIAYIASAYDGTDDLNDQWNAYVDALAQFDIESRTPETATSVRTNKALEETSITSPPNTGVARNGYPTDTVQIFCMRCGASIPSTAAYCWSCGDKQSNARTVTSEKNDERPHRDPPFPTSAVRTQPARRSNGSKVLRGIVWVVIGFAVGQLASFAVTIALAGFIGPDTSPWHQLAALGVWVYVGYNGYHHRLPIYSGKRPNGVIRAGLITIVAAVGLMTLALLVGQMDDSEPKTSNASTEFRWFGPLPTSTPSFNSFAFTGRPEPTTPTRSSNSYLATRDIRYRVAGYGFPRGDVRISYTDSSGGYSVDMVDVQSSAWARSVFVPMNSPVRISVQPLVGSATCEIYVNGRLAIRKTALRSTEGIAICEL